MPHLNLKGHKMEMPRPLMVFTLKLYPFQISHFLECEMRPLILIFQHLYQLKLAETFVKCEMEMRPAPPNFSPNLDTDLNSKFARALLSTKRILVFTLLT